jgi:hypothetical protein
MYVLLTDCVLNPRLAQISKQYFAIVNDLNADTRPPDEDARRTTVEVLSAARSHIATSSGAVGGSGGDGTGGAPAGTATRDLDDNNSAACQVIRQSAMTDLKRDSWTGNDAYHCTVCTPCSVACCIVRPR